MNGFANNERQNKPKESQRKVVLQSFHLNGPTRG